MAEKRKEAISIEPALYERLGNTARLRGVSPERLLAEALAAFLPDEACPEAAGAAQRPIRQGDIYWVLPAEEGAVGAGVPHPRVVIQEDVLNRSRLNSVVVCALTSNLKRAKAPGNVLLDPGEANLPRRSVVEVSKVSAVEKSRLGAYIGSVSRGRIEQILAGLEFVEFYLEPHETLEPSETGEEAELGDGTALGDDAARGDEA